MDNNLLKELVKNQLKNVPVKWKLELSDIKRISKYIDNSIFDPTECSIWNGYITNNNSNKGSYVNFYFKNKKIALHRLLYSNYVVPLADNEYLKYKCNNKGKCCNINHYEKYTYLEKNNIVETHKKNKEKHVFKIDDEDNSIVINLLN